MLLIWRAQYLTVAGVFTELGSNGRSWQTDLLRIAVAILEWNAANEICSSTGPAGSCSFCIQSDASLVTSCWDENSYELLFNSSGFSFPPFVGLISIYGDGNLFLHVDVFSYTNTNGGYFNLHVESMFYGKMRLLCWTTSCSWYIQWCSKQTAFFEVWEGRLFQVVVFNAQFIINTSMNILNSLVLYKEPFQGNFRDQCLFPCLQVYH